MSSTESSNVTSPQIWQPIKRVVIIGAMADFKPMDKPSWIKMGKNLSAHFIAFIQRKYG